MEGRNPVAHWLWLRAGAHFFAGHMLRYEGGIDVIWVQPMSKHNGSDDPMVKESLTSPPRTPSQKRAAAFEIVFALVVAGTLVGAIAGWWPWQVIFLVMLLSVGTGLLGRLLGLWSLADLSFGDGGGDSSGFGGDGGGG